MLAVLRCLFDSVAGRMNARMLAMGDEVDMKVRLGIPDE
jgi:hypothetical protein